MNRVIKLVNNKVLKAILSGLFVVVIIGTAISNEWLILAAMILMIFSVMITYFKTK